MRQRPYSRARAITAVYHGCILTGWSRVHADGQSRLRTSHASNFRGPRTPLEPRTHSRSLHRKILGHFRDPRTTRTSGTFEVLEKLARFGTCASINLKKSSSQTVKIKQLVQSKFGWTEVMYFDMAVAAREALRATLLPQYISLLYTLAQIRQTHQYAA